MALTEAGVSAGGEGFKAISTSVTMGGAEFTGGIKAAVATGGVDAGLSRLATAPIEAPKVSMPSVDTAVSTPDLAGLAKGGEPKDPLDPRPAGVKTETPAPTSVDAGPQQPDKTPRTQEQVASATAAAGGNVETAVADAQTGNTVDADAGVKAGETATVKTGEAQPTKGAETDKKALEGEEKKKRVDELSQKVKDGKATKADAIELRELKQDPAERQKDLTQKALDGKITDQEAAELGKLNAAAQEGGNNLTEEQQTEKLKTEIEDLGTEIMMDLAAGKPINQEQLDKLRELRGQEQLATTGFTKEQARAAVKEGLHGNSASNERQGPLVKEVQQKIQELMALEIQLLSIPKTVDALRDQGKELLAKANKKHSEAQGEKNDEARLQKQMEENGLYAQVAQVHERIVGQKYQVPVMEAKAQDIQQYIRRKVGASHGIGAVMEFGAAKLRNVSTQVGVGMREEWDYRTGNY